VGPVAFFWAAAFAFLAAALRMVWLAASHESRPVARSPLRNRQPSTPTTSPLSTLTRPFHRCGVASPTPRVIRTAVTDGSSAGPDDFPPPSPLWATTAEAPSSPTSVTTAAASDRMARLLDRVALLKT